MTSNNELLELIHNCIKALIARTEASERLAKGQATMADYLRIWKETQAAMEAMENEWKRLDLIEAAKAAENPVKTKMKGR